MSSTAEMLMTLSIFPYLYFLYVLNRVRKERPELVHPLTYYGFLFMLAFIFVTAGIGYYAVFILGAPTLGHVDYLHGLSESGLTITNGLVLAGLKRHLKQLDATGVGRGK
ncbi:DUF3593 domain-containing protein [Heliobacterium gestii]|uniref:DUF3593 domain-containing protein n=1 Tax=Heliomicrobium gestii TaxID=2699 RepID=A0A845LE67_HELGE|nr:DUF3593 domain-containing protein [Heliomicrobium gestii]MBM7866471.1 type IV secretory pathway TrbL component [Heliomicrobium gestii]MZP42745.1 DUF3593 domain-containing protein [Heliomicrobium gestii]